jgi:hypothetical protein
VLRILQGLNDVTVDEGEPIELICQIEGIPSAVKWFKNGQEVSPDGRVEIVFL